MTERKAYSIFLDLPSSVIFRCFVVIYPVFGIPIRILLNLDSHQKIPHWLPGMLASLNVCAYILEIKRVMCKGIENGIVILVKKWGYGVDVDLHLILTADYRFCRMMLPEGKRLGYLVSTSILSKKWRYIWSRIPQLTLDQTLWETTKDLISPSLKFTNILYHLLTLHSGPITKFTLSIPELGNCPKFDNLIYFLSKNGIQHLLLLFPEDNRYEFPSLFFTCWQMRCLVLENCFIVHPPPNFKGFPRLVTLQLFQVINSSKLIESLIAHSPLLKHLVLQSDILDHIQVNAPNLRTIHFTGKIKYISLKNVPLLEELSLWDPEYFVDAGKVIIPSILSLVLLLSIST
ncbi:F-box/FBD/LRR-repeat protein At1g13570-like [Lycium barbarum]|uniref:F-box/FBD/LRR-repeat protein At1g13570-like n=1 Tax=Lycium barbarum TaxID=112863 RepID=UPI00293E01E7|nr:F-box/FBD/LRR-repeat protein At1g13570-like [Lycium barbarum]